MKPITLVQFGTNWFAARIDDDTWGHLFLNLDTLMFVVKELSSRYVGDELAVVTAVSRYREKNLPRNTLLSLGTPVREL